MGRLEIAETGSNISFPKKLDFDPMTANKIVLSLVDGSSSCYRRHVSSLLSSWVAGSTSIGCEGLIYRA